MSVAGISGNTRKNIKLTDISISRRNFYVYVDEKIWLHKNYIAGLEKSLEQYYPLSKN
jgi:hypothetical protein